MGMGNHGTRINLKIWKQNNGLAKINIWNINIKVAWIALMLAILNVNFWPVLVAVHEAKTNENHLATTELPRIKGQYDYY